MYSSEEVVTLPLPEAATAIAPQRSKSSADRIYTAKRNFPATPCEGPGCKNIVPAGRYSAAKRRSFCSFTCRGRSQSQYPIGICPYCEGTILGKMSEMGKKKFCNYTHWAKFETEQVLGPTGSFRSIIEEYITLAAPNFYGFSTVYSVRVSLAKFFRFAAQVEELSKLEDVRPSTITRFIGVERERGLTSRNFVGHLSTFFNWLIAEERYSLPNPVVSRIHSQRGAAAQPRPYDDADLRKVWDLVKAGRRSELMLAFSLGEECGLRVGEVCNIRLSDVNESAQTIFVRLPTKNKRTRTVPYHNKVKENLALWLAERDANCGHDHLLHNNTRSPFVTGLLDSWFKNLLSKEPDPGGSFGFHRLRHTWATRLMNGGMEIAVLKALGGWESWNSMQRYIRVLDSTVQRQYEESYRKLQEHDQAEADETLSLLDFALLTDGKDINSVETAA